MYMASSRGFLGEVVVSEFNVSFFLHFKELQQRRFEHERWDMAKETAFCLARQLRHGRTNQWSCKGCLNASVMEEVRWCALLKISIVFIYL